MCPRDPRRRVSGDNRGVKSLAGRLLVATPSTGGDVFTRSVVLMLHHSDDGAHGVVLNKPLGVDVTPVLPDWQLPAAPVHAVFASARYLTPKVRAFIDLAVEAFAG